MRRARLTGGRSGLEAHGGYFVRLERLAGVDLACLAREALREDGVLTADAGLLVSAAPDGRVLRLAYDAPHTYGRRGACWYGRHHALARALTRALPVTVHAYVFDPEAYEEVATYGGGRRVGGERLEYMDAELPEDGDGELDERAFEQLRARWPLGHLAQVLGLYREELLRLPRARSVLVPLDGRAGAADELAELWPTLVRGEDDERA